MNKPLVAFRYYGGKNIHLPWILPMVDLPCHHYVEPFGGSAALLLNRKPSEIETYNDLNENILNFFDVLRNDTDELLRQLSLTPYHKGELARAAEARSDFNDLTKMERARLFYFSINSTMHALPGKIRKSDFSVCITSKNSSSYRYYNSLSNLEKIVERCLLYTSPSPRDS